MNKVYKVVWNQAKNAYSVVSEFAKQHSRSSASQKKGVALLTAALLLSGVVGVSAADPVIPDAKPGTGAGTAVSETAKAEKEGSVAIGKLSAAHTGVAIGNGARSDKNQPGWGDVTEGQGGYLVASGENNGIAIGEDALAGAGVLSDKRIDPGIPDTKQYINVPGTHGRTIYNMLGMMKINPDKANEKFFQNRKYNADKIQGTTWDEISKYVHDSGKNQVSIGNGSRALGNQGIAIGSKAVAGRSSVVIGGSELGDGSDKDSLRGMFIENNLLKELSGFGAPGTDSHQNTAMAHAGEASVAIGTKAHSRSPFTVAIGTLSNVENNAFGSIAIGAVSNVAASGSDKPSIGAIAIGMGAVTYGHGNISLGVGASTWASANTHRATALGAWTKASAADSVAIGSLSDSGRSGNMAGYFYGREANLAVPKDKQGSITAEGKTMEEEAKKSSIKVKAATFTIPEATATDATNGVRIHTYEGLKNGALTANAGAISVGRSDVTRQIINVAAGTQDTDAVNVAQLRNINMMVEADKGVEKKPALSDMLLDRNKLKISGESFLSTELTDDNGNLTVTLKADREKLAEEVNAENVAKENLPLSYVDEEGNPLVKLGDKYYKLDAQGNPDKTAEAKPAGIKANGQDKDGNPLSITHVARGTSDISTPADASASAIDKAKAGLADMKAPAGKSNENTVATVGDLKRMGFVVAAGDTYAEKVTNAQVVKFVGTGLADVSGKTEGDVRTITVNVDEKKVKDIVNNAAKVTVEAKAGSAVSVTSEDLKDGGKKYIVDVAKDGTIGGDKDGNLVTGDTVKKYIADNQTTVAGDKEKGVVVTKEGNAYKVSLGDTVKAGNVTVGGEKGKEAVTGLSNKDWNPDAIESGRAATEDQLKKAIDSVNANGGKALEEAKKHTTVVAGDNVKVEEKQNENGGKEYTVSVAKDLKGLDRVETKEIKAGDVTIDKDGIHGGNKPISDVADGVKPSDAVNKRQLDNVQKGVDANKNAISQLGNQIGAMDGRINQVGAGSAALAALHPLDFDPDDKWDIAAGYGNYNGSHAGAVGAFYRPNEDTMVSVGGSFGGGQNMVNAGVSVKLGQGNHVSTSKLAMAKEIKDLRQEVEMLRQALVGVSEGKKMDPMKTKLFPDIPENHWAYEEIHALAKTGVIEGYPNGKFLGDRMMTRYEFACMLYRAMQQGAQVNVKLIREFEPELERFRIDVIAQDENGVPTIERVRANKTK